MSGRKQTTPEQDAAIWRLHVEGNNATQIHRRLIDEGLLYEPHPNVTVRTVQNRVKDMTPPDDSGLWSLADADPDEVRAIADVVRYWFWRTSGRVWFSQEIARLIATLRHTWPELPPSWAYLAAKVYQLVREKGQDSRCLDLLMCSKPWEIERGQLQQTSGVVMRCFNDLGPHSWFDGWELLLEEAYLRDGDGDAFTASAEQDVTTHAEGNKVVGIHAPST